MPVADNLAETRRLLAVHRARQPQVTGGVPVVAGGSSLELIEAQTYATLALVEVLSDILAALASIATSQERVRP